MSDTRAAAMPLAWTFEGKEYLVSPRTWRHMLAFQVWHEAQALEAVRRQQDSLPAEVFDRLLAQWSEQSAGGKFEWDTPLNLEKRRSPSGVKQLVYLSLKEKNPSVDMHLIDRIWENDEAATSLATLLRRLNGPNPQAPEQAPEQPTPATTAA